MCTAGAQYLRFGLSQAAEGVDQISAVVQTNSATAEQSAASSQDLSYQAKMLQQLTDRFHIGEN